MERLFYFFYQYRAFFTFLVLELFAAWLIVKNNQYQSTKYFNSSNRLAANVIGTTQGIKEYFSLRKINTELADENAQLRTKLEQRNQSLYTLEVRERVDPKIINRFDFISAKVINNSVERFKNYITIDKGALDGISPGMAVISAAGAVGKVKSVSDHYAVLISLLNTDEFTSSIIKRTNHFGSINWDGKNPRYSQLNFIPRHANPTVGDTVVTSGFNAVFPEGVLVGIIEEVSLGPEAQFYDLKVRLAQDFSSLAFVEIVRSSLLYEKDSLEKITIGESK
ncbi:MAG TPA: rod shape-determining protein MreC [Cyclobacteriaceae bacterium]|jgi:rod shape-determining protein MreC|nr:rod shape-determining protein MreC [Cyclobacteriaceae bacterium]HRK53659.1 rod shape-determining protein MreC [Cyclobacteriaceae bacterium]